MWFETQKCGINPTQYGDCIGENVLFYLATMRCVRAAPPGGLSVFCVRRTLIVVEASQWRVTQSRTLGWS